MAMFTRKKAPSSDLIDLREEPARPQWGSPVPCPSCDGRGYLDHIDPFKEIMFLHCTQCGHKYELTKAEMGIEDSSEAFTL